MHWKRVQRGAPLTGVDDARYALLDAALDEALEPALVDLLKADAVLRAIPSDVTQDPACAEALRRFGDRRRFEREVLAVHAKREASMRRTEYLRDLAHDFRLAMRHLRRRPAFTLITVLVIALGIGANSAVFAVVDAALLRPLPYPRADELVHLWDQQDEQTGLPLS